MQELENIKNKINWRDIYGNLRRITPGTNGWMKASCPFTENHKHGDQNPSFTFNINHKSFECFGCGAKGDMFSFLMLRDDKDFKTVINELRGQKEETVSAQEDFKDVQLSSIEKPDIGEDLVIEMMLSLNRTAKAKTYLINKRGLTEETLKTFQIGWSIERKRFSIPIRDKTGKLCNIRYYTPKPIHKSPKIISHTDKKYSYGEARLYGIDRLNNTINDVYFCEGEWDRLLLEQNGFTALTGTAGCKTFKSEWLEYFKGRNVIILYDVDQPGKDAVANHLIPAFKQIKDDVKIKIVELPLLGTKDDKDLTDYFVKRRYTGKDLQALINQQSMHIFNQQKTYTLDSLLEIDDNKYIDKYVRVNLTVCGGTSEAYHAVSEFKVTYCKHMSAGKCQKCTNTIKVPLNSTLYISACTTSDEQMEGKLRRFCCNIGQRPNVEIVKKSTIKEFFAHQIIDRIAVKKENANNSVNSRKIYYLSSEHIKPGNYEAIGYVKTHPKTSGVTLLIEKLIAQEEDFQTFKVDKNLELLRTMRDNCGKILIDDLVKNVTKIYERDNILTAYLLAYLSPLHINFNGRRVRSWINLLIMGDAGTGKTQTFTKLAEFLNIGDMVSGLTAGRTGLFYALDQHPVRGWQVNVGRYPSNHKKLLCVDEAQKFEITETLMMSKAMEEGIVQIDKIKSMRLETQTRLILICNPKSGNKMASYTYGCLTIPELYTQAFIRRIDLAVFANVDDIKRDNHLMRLHNSESKSKVSPEMLRALVYWAWNLRPEQIIFSKDVTIKCLKIASRQAKKYCYAEDIPLILAADHENNLARIATAHAVLDGSINDKFEKLYVREEHLYMAEGLMDALYSNVNCGLDKYNRTEKDNNNIEDYQNIKNSINKAYPGYKDVIKKVLITLMSTHEDMRRDVLQEEVDVGFLEFEKCIKMLKSHKLIKNGRFGMKKTIKFNKFIGMFENEYPDFFVNGMGKND